MKPIVATYQAQRITRRRRKQEKAREAAKQQAADAATLEGFGALETLPAANGQVAKEVNG